MGGVRVVHEIRGVIVRRYIIAEKRVAVDLRASSVTERGGGEDKTADSLRAGFVVSVARGNVIAVAVAEKGVVEVLYRVGRAAPSTCHARELSVGRRRLYSIRVYAAIEARDHRNSKTIVNASVTAVEHRQREA